MVSKDESKQITESGNMANQDWDAAWESDEEEHPLPQGTNRASLEEARRASEISSSEPTPDVTTAALDDDDAAEAWGWADEDAADEPISEDVVEPPPRESPAPNLVSLETREVTLSESYKTSSIPQPVFKTVSGIFNDGARLTSLECVLPFPILRTFLTKLFRFEHCPVTPAAPVLFSLPTLVLAMYRAVSPYYYAHHQIGNM
jgi:centromere/kinetochore protein ZW10